MIMYRVIVKFKDLQDNGYVYNVGDIFPRVGLDVTDERIAELASDSNRRGIPLIREVKRGRRKQSEQAG